MSLHAMPPSTLSLQLFVEMAMKIIMTPIVVMPKSMTSAISTSVETPKQWQLITENALKDPKPS
jgi:hypothetical protein